MAKRTKEDSDKTRQRLIEAAEALFLEKGVSKTSLSDVASAAGMTRGAIYWHFKNKGELFHALLEEGGKTLDHSFSVDTEDSLNPLEQLKLQTINGLKECLTNPRLINLFKILFHKCELSDELISYMVDFRGRFCGSIKETETCFKKAIREHILPDNFDAELAACSFQAYVTGIIHLSIATEDDFSLQERLSTVLAIFFNGLPILKS